MDRLTRRMFEPVDAASMVAVRVLFGLLMAVGVVRFWAMGWIEALYIEPAYLFSYWGLEWIPRPGPLGMYGLFACMLVAALAIAIGRAYRLAAASFFVSFTWVELLDQTNYLNHYYLVSLVAFLLAWMPLSAGTTRVPRWTIWALRGQLGIVYTYAGIAKLNADWLLHAEPLRTWLETRRTVPLVGPLLAWDPTAFAMSWLGAGFDLVVFAALLHRKSRPLAYVAVVGFHVLTWSLFPIGMFPWVMIALTTVFFAPSWPRRLLARRSSPRGPAPAAARRSPSWARAAVAGVLAFHFTLQLALPLRHLGYPGSDAWHMQTFRFSWKVMLVEKSGMVEYRVVDPTSGRSWRVSPHDELTPQQTRQMAMQPDMICQYAHHLARRYAARGYPDVQIYAEAWAALNGRRSQRHLAADVDLAHTPDGLEDKTWISPAPQ
jgi:hypothetical protein